MYKSLRAFIGAENFEISINFYKDLGFREFKLNTHLSVFKIDDKLSFYLQKAYVKDWVNNSMLFLEVENIETYFLEIKNKNFSNKYPKVKLSKIVNNDWGKEFFLHDPSGILWHIGCFND